MQAELSVSTELRRLFFVSARWVLFTAPAGVALIYLVLGGSITSMPQVVWAISAACAGVGLSLLCHLILQKRLRLSPLVTRALFIANTIVSQSFLLVFHPALMTREAMLEPLAGAILCLSLTVALSADHLIARSTVISSMALMAIGADSLLRFPPLIRLLAMIPLGILFMQIADMLHHQQRRNIELQIENVVLIDDLRAANALLASQVKLDALTGLMNRAGLEEEFEKQRPVGLLYIDVDSFKAVNDTHGHAVGDQVLQRIGEAMRAVSRPGDVVARIGGDEFIMLLDGANDRAAIEAGNRICNHVRLMLAINGVTVSIGATCGVVGEELPDAIIARADRGLYAAKKLGGNRLEVALT